MAEAGSANVLVEIRWLFRTLGNRFRIQAIAMDFFYYLNLILYLLVVQVCVSLSVMVGHTKNLSELISSRSRAQNIREMETQKNMGMDNKQRQPDKANPDLLTMGEVTDAEKVHLMKIPCQVIDSPYKPSYNCSLNSDQDKKETMKNMKQCGKNSRAVGESCVCEEGYRKFPDSRRDEFCVKVQGQHCFYSKNDCSYDATLMSCVNGVCECDNSDFYDPITMRCVGKVGGLCYPEIKDCISNAECVRVPKTVRPRREASSEYYYYDKVVEQFVSSDYTFSSENDIEFSGRCQCEQGYVESKGGSCKKGIGQTCSSVHECDSLNLVCKEGVCICPDILQVYDFVSKSCVALVGATCSNEPGGTLCVKHAQCEKMNLKLPAGRCVCVERAVETDKRTCLLVEYPPPSGINVNLDDWKKGDSRRITFVYS